MENRATGSEPRLPSCGFRVKEQRLIYVELTAVVVDELLQAAELRAWCDVETAAVQLPDLVVLYIKPFGVVVVQYRQTVGTFSGAQAQAVNDNVTFFLCCLFLLISKEYVYFKKTPLYVKVP